MKALETIKELVSGTDHDVTLRYYREQKSKTASETTSSTAHLLPNMLFIGENAYKRVVIGNPHIA
jgi:hypothetical protein